MTSLQVQKMYLGSAEIRPIDEYLTCTPVLKKNKDGCSQIGSKSSYIRCTF